MSLRALAESAAASTQSLDAALSAPATPSAAAPLASLARSCLNCGHALPLPQPAFCPACGQETRSGLPSLGEFLQLFGGAYLSTEGALWRTLKLLITRPGELTVQYLAGRRKHYALPLRLYLTISLLVLLLLRLTSSVDLVSGLDRPEIRAAEQGALPSLTLVLGPLKLGVKEGQFVCEPLPPLMCSLLRERAAPDARTFLNKLRLANERVLSHLGVVMFVLLPLFAVCLWIVNRHIRQPYAAHLVFALHLHAFWFLLLGLTPWGGTAMAWACAAAAAVYTLLAGRRVYGGAWWQRAWRALVLSALYIALLALTVPLAWLLALLA